MCGIAGYINLDGAPVQAATLETMVRLLKHRGPDDDGIYADGNVGIVHTRLSILDLSRKAHQPMESERYVLTYNGELYNFQDIREDLRSRGYVFCSQSDTEVLLHAYDAYQEECLERLNGMFAFAIYDKRDKDVFLARDRLGIKPLYYVTNAKVFAWSSEIAPLVKARLAPKELNYQAVSDFLTLCSVPDPETIYKDVVCLEPGSCLRVRRGSSSVTRKYWDVRRMIDSERFADRPDEEVVAGFERLLSNAVRLRRVSDVPVGVFLSGGLDSAAITALMKSDQSDLHTFTLGSNNKAMDESALARRIADHVGSIHHEYIVTDSDVANHLGEMTKAMNQPHSGCYFETYYLSQQCRNDIVVALSGAGCDEVLAGYQPFRTVLRRIHLLSRLMPMTIVMPVLGALQFADVMRRINSILNAARPKDPMHREIARKPYTEEEKRRLLKLGDRELLPTVRIYEKALEGVPQLSNLLTFSLLDLQVYVVNEFLQCADSAGMAHGLEIRTPFLDHRLVEYGINVPERLKLQGSTTKVALRRILQARVPDAVLRGKKKGFGTPRFEYIKKGLRPIADEVFSTASIKARGLFDPGILPAMWTDFCKKERRMPWSWFNRIWAPFTLELWLREHYDKTA